MTWWAECLVLVFLQHISRQQIKPLHSVNDYSWGVLSTVEKPAASVCFLSIPSTVGEQGLNFMGIWYSFSGQELNAISVFLYALISKFKDEENCDACYSPLSKHVF